MHPDARALVDTLRLKPHPEGGFYREAFRSSARVTTPRENSTISFIPIFDSYGKC